MSTIEDLNKLKEMIMEVAQVAKVQSGIIVTFSQIETQFKGLREVVTLQQEWDKQRFDHTETNLDKLEEWQKWWYREIGRENASQTEQIKTLKTQLKMSSERTHEMMLNEYEAGRKQNRSGNDKVRVIENRSKDNKEIK